MEEGLKDAWEALEETREEMTGSIGRFARDEAARVVAETVPPVVEVRPAAASSSEHHESVCPAVPVARRSPAGDV
ncbi:hypothetical protein [Nonomuraea sp. NPDC050691]|uniref:hypothetical protein n=1 Tax=Nonomuraea sp. NPDC050691 TaxID=3155661 RepID=UPI0033E4BDE1